MTPKQAQRLVGRTIATVDLRKHWEGEDGNRVLMHDPVLTLDDGSRLQFVGEEHPEGGEMGVCPVHGPPRRGRTPTAAALLVEAEAALQSEIDTESDLLAETIRAYLRTSGLR